MMTSFPPTSPREFARSWINAWNARDLDAVLTHFSEDFEFSSPHVARVTGEASGRLKGKAAVRAYWNAALAGIPELHFELVDVLSGIRCMVILYRGHQGLSAEMLDLDENGRAVRGQALYMM